MALTLHGTVADNTAVLDRRYAKPLIINGDMAVSQRGTSFSASTSEIYTLDRFKYIDIDSPDNVYTITQDSDVPSGQGFAKSLKVDVATADASLDSLDGTLIEQRIEAQDLQQLSFGTSSAKSLTLAFWVKSNKTGTYVVRLLQSDNSSKQVSYSYTISSANTWEKKIINIPGDTAGVITNDNGSGLQISWLLSAGAGLQSGALRSAWTAYANGDVAVGQVNLADSTDNEWYLTGVQLEVGEFDANSIAAFQHESYGDSLARCQRYFFKTFAQGTTPAQNVGANNTLVNGAHTAIQDNRYPSYELPVEMRAAGTATSFNPYAANSSFRVPGSSTDVAISSITITTHAIVFVCTSADTGVFHIHFTLDGEL
jgi:hypothetical protein